MRLFVAVDVGDELRSETTRVRSEVEAALRKACKELPRIVWVAPSALHVTLRFLGEVHDAQVPHLESSLAPPIPVAPFDVEWRGLGVFPGPRDPRALWIGAVRGAEDLGALEGEVSRRLSSLTTAAVGAPEMQELLRTMDEERRPFRAHVTIGRVKSRAVGADWPKVIEDAAVRAVRTRVDHVTLYRSTLSPRGPAYTPMVVTPLIRESGVGSRESDDKNRESGA